MTNTVSPKEPLVILCHHEWTRHAVARRWTCEQVAAVKKFFAALAATQPQPHRN